jgi:ferrochelatase
MKSAVVLMAHGSPEVPEQMGEFLQRIMKRDPSPALVAQMQERYRLIGGRSPLSEITRRQAERLQAVLGMPVSVGMLHWPPLIAEAARAIEADRLVALPATPFGGPYGGEKYLRALEGVAAVPVRPWADDPHLARAWVASLSGLVDERSTLLFTAHSVPADCGPYSDQVRGLVEAILLLMGDLPHALAWQSRSSAPGAWLEPDVDAVLAELAAGGARRVVVAPVGFLCDHVEILYDLDILHRETARALGLEYVRAPMLNDAPMLIEAMAAAVRSAS